jgi:hypothetical protein
LFRTAYSAALAAVSTENWKGRHMGKVRWLGAGLLLASLGCSRQDPEHLARVGARVGRKAEAALAGDGRFLRGWQSLRASWLSMPA